MIGFGLLVVETCTWEQDAWLPKQFLKSFLPRKWAPATCIRCWTLGIIAPTRIMSRSGTWLSSSSPIVPWSKLFYSLHTFDRTRRGYHDNDGDDNDLSGDDIIIVVRVDDDPASVGGNLVRRLLSPGRGRRAEDQLRPVSDRKHVIPILRVGMMADSKDNTVK